MVFLMGYITTELLIRQQSKTRNCHVFSGRHPVADIEFEMEML
jgi:hypothetical protein